jgi:hypothetical protein
MKPHYILCNILTELNIPVTRAGLMNMCLYLMYSKVGVGDVGVVRLVLEQCGTRRYFIYLKIRYTGL